MRPDRCVPAAGAGPRRPGQARRSQNDYGGVLSLAVVPESSRVAADRQACVCGVRPRRDQASPPSTGRGNAPGTAEPHHRTRNRHHTRPRTAGEDGRPTCPATIGRARGVHVHQPPCDTVTSPRVPVSVRRIGRPAGGSPSPAAMTRTRSCRGCRYTPR